MEGRLVSVGWLVTRMALAAASTHDSYRESLKHIELALEHVAGSSRANGRLTARRLSRTQRRRASADASVGSNRWLLECNCGWARGVLSSS
jgi:hypothetical protein